jgi:repressor LexA
VGRVAAGAPILAQEHVDQTYVVEASMFPRRPDYLLKARGMSMRDAGILDGDLIAVQRARDAKTARSWWPGSVTRSRSSVFGAPSSTSSCCPENPDFQPIVVSPRMRASNSRAWPWA